MSKNKSIYGIILLLLIGSLLFLIFRNVQDVKAVFDPDKAVPINPVEIENSTLIIGSHLIHLSAVNDEIYKVAKESAEDSAQTKIYYKSEIGAGKWYDITQAGELADITVEGVPVSDEEIHQLYMTHHTKSNGITYDLRNNRSISVFDIKSLYEIRGLEELEPLWNHYDITDVEKTKSEIANLYQHPLSTEQTKIYDKQMKELQNYDIALKQKKALPEWTESVQKIMGKVDAARRIIVLKLAEYYLLEIEQKENLEEGLLNALGESRQNIAESLLTYEANVLAEGTTVMSKKEYRLSLELVNLAKQGPINQEAGDGIVKRLVHLLHIMDSKIVNIPGEIAMLDELILEMEVVLRENLARGEVWDISLEDRKSELETFRNELEFYIQARIDRMDKKEALTYIEDKIVKVGEYKQIIIEDTMKKDSQNVVESHLEWLTGLLGNIEDRGEKADIQKLKEEKEALEEKMREAMDKNLLDQAKRYQALAQDKGEEVKKIESDINKKLENLNKQKEKEELNGGNTGEIEKQIAILKKELPEGSESKNIQDMKKKALEILRQGKTADKEKDIILVQIEGLGAILEGGSVAAAEALKEIYKKVVSESYLNDDPKMEDIIKRIEDIIIENNVVLKGNTLTKENVAKAVAEAVGTDSEEDPDMKEAKGEDLTAALAALSKALEESSNKELEELAATMAQKLYESGREDMDLFPYYTAATGNYVPVSGIAKYLKYRYVWSDSKKIATMSKGADFYSFIAFEKRYIHGGKDTAQMPQVADFKLELYIPVSFVEEEFHCKIYPIAKSGYAIILKDEIEDKAEEIKESLLEKFR